MITRRVIIEKAGYAWPYSVVLGRMGRYDVEDCEISSYFKEAKGTYKTPTGILLDKELTEYLSYADHNTVRLIRALIAYMGTLHFGRPGFLQIRMVGTALLYKVISTYGTTYEGKESMEHLDNYAFVDEQLFWFKPKK